MIARSETVRPIGPPALRARWYRSLAYALHATAPPGGILFESTLGDPVPWVTVRPASLVETVRASPTLRALELRRRTGPPHLDPPAGSRGEVRVLIAARAGTGASRASAAGREAPEVGALAGSGGWVGVQTVWLRDERGGVAVARRYRFGHPDPAEFSRRAPRVAVAIAEAWADATGADVVARRARRPAVRDWRRGTFGALPRDAWLGRPADGLERTAEALDPVPLADGGPEGHRIVFGASGAGKTTYLARLSADRAAGPGGVLVIDLHGDLAPAVVARLDPGALPRVVAIDAADAPVPGIAALRPADPGDDRAAAHLVAALKRLSPDGSEIHWGFRLERIFDSFVRLVLEQGGSLVDLYGLLTDPDRRDAARLATRRPDLARFLEELGPVMKRQPDFLWSAATRLAKVVLSRPLTELLAPADGGLPVEELLRSGRSVLVRLPFATLGPEASAFAATLVVARTYLGLAALGPDREPSVGVLVVLDEAHAFSPRLLTELLTESRKFGLRVLLATQYPERFAPELAHAVAGALTDVVTFRVPRRSARHVGEWVGLPAEDGERWLPRLPPGHGVALDSATGEPRAVAPALALPATGSPRWKTAVLATRAEFGTHSGADAVGEGDRATERLLLALLAAEEEGRTPPDVEGLRAAADRLPGVPAGPEESREAWAIAQRTGLVAEDRNGVRLTFAGARRLGVSAPTGAARESDEHRRLLVAAFRLFARRGYRIEILRQGRFDTTLPDARFHQLPLPASAPPHLLGEAIDRARSGWAWRCFGGRDVHIEAEVSGALRPERIRHGLRKATARDAFALFVVGNADRAARVRRVLRAVGLRPDRAQVWTLGPGGPAGPQR